MMRGTHHQGRQRAGLEAGLGSARETDLPGTVEVHARPGRFLSQLGRITSFPLWSGLFSLLAHLSQNAPRYLSDLLEFRFYVRRLRHSFSSPSLVTEDSEGEFAGVQENV